MNVGTVGREIGQSRPFASRRQEAALSLLKTADWARRSIAGVVEAEGVTPQQYNVLRILRGARPDGLATLEVGRRMVEQAPGVTRLLDRMEAKGLVTRCRGGDRRQVRCAVTGAGLAILARLDPAVAALHESMLPAFTDDEVETLIRLLDRARQPSSPAGSGPTNLNEKEKRP